MIGRSVLLAAVVLGLAAQAGFAQELTGIVKRPGMVGLTLEGDATWFRSRYVDGGEEPLGSGFGGPLSPQPFAPLADLAAATEGFLTAVDSTSSPLPDSDFLAGDLDTRLSWNARVGRARLGVGVLPRLEIGVGASIYRTEMFPLRRELTGGTLGRNPDPGGNAALLAGIDDTGQAVGAAPVLPVEGSPLGSQLQDLVFAATGDSLALPGSALTIDEFAAAFGSNPFAHQVSPVRLGDLEIDARVELLRTFDEDYFPEDGWFNARLTALGGLRIGTGDRGLETPLPDWGPDVGFGGVSGGGILDVFGGRALWGTLGIGVSRLNAATVLVSAGSALDPLNRGSVEARVEPGTEVRLGAAARVRMTRELSLGGNFQSVRRDAGTVDGASVSRAIPARSLRSLGLEIRYSSLAAYQQDRTITPIDAVVGFRTAISGSGLAPASTVAFAGVTILHRLWGASE